MDATPLYPAGFHPQNPYLTPDAKTFAPVRRRYSASFPKYHIIDFVISTWFRDGDDNRLVTGTDGQDKSVPELHANKPYDPFKVDIYTLGNVFKNELIHVSFRILGLPALPLTCSLAEIQRAQLSKSFG